MSEDWYLMTSNNKYLSGFELDSFEEAYDAFGDLLDQSPESYNVQVNSVDKRIIIQTTHKSINKTILFSKGNINQGDIVLFDDLNWLVLDMPTFNRIYEKSIMAVCNETFTVVEKGERYIKDFDELGRPEYGWHDDKNHEISCVVESSAESMYSRDKVVNMPEGTLSIKIPFDKSHLITLETKIDVFDAPYQVYNINKANVFKGKGVVELFVRKTTT
ncbi:hypothetical protein JOC34_000450 [Virgibacillus halotolerans]|uniref:hypothetical protein n=1 Tax=Virgibacillus halotolerans TaxID=1071053 RepID=UPI0019622844|nr:hypothetical protein [Virgibacillus halotolerans]MBM7598093.1 hypothetical protein [Virgibacillus halotolerans]